MKKQLIQKTRIYVEGKVENLPTDNGMYLAGTYGSNIEYSYYEASKLVNSKEDWLENVEWYEVEVSDPQTEVGEIADGIIEYKGVIYYNELPEIKSPKASLQV